MASHKIAHCLFGLSLLLVTPACASEKSTRQDDIASSTAMPVGEKTAPTTTKSTTDNGENSETYKLLKLFTAVFERTRAQYVEPVNDEELIEAAINGMLTHLDPHSNYMNKQEWNDMQVQTRGIFGGLGIEVTLENGVIKVISPIDDTPASRAGIKAGDLIVELDDQPVMGLTLQEAVNKMRGTPGTAIKLMVVREGQGEPLPITLTRAIIKVESVKWRVQDKIGYIRISSFTDRTQDGVNRAIADIKKQLGKDLEGWVLDLRNNPGGLLEQAISVSDTFLNDGQIVSTRARNPLDFQEFKATPGDQAEGKPIVVLINEGSASASEIVSGALQDNHRAVIMGVKSFGKGSVQSVIPLEDHGAMKLTTARYYTPSGRSIQAEGIVPDIDVKQAKVEVLDQKGLTLREANLRGALNNDASPQEASPTPAAPVPAAGDKKTPLSTPIKGDGKNDGTKTDDKQEEPDYQLDRAVDLIRGINVYNRTSAPISQTEQAATMDDNAKTTTPPTSAAPADVQPHHEP